MDVFRIRGDVLSARSIHLEPTKNEIKYPWFDGTPKGDWFKPRGLFIKDIRKPITNFYYMSNSLVFDEKVLELMGDLLVKAGEIFPIQVDGADQLYILNPTVVLDALDKDNYEPKVSREGRQYGIRKYAFLPHAFNESSLFLLATMEFGPIFVVSGYQDDSDEVVDRYLKNKLTGLELTKMWSG